MSVGLTKLKLNKNSNPNKANSQGTKDLSKYSSSNNSTASLANSFSAMQKNKIDYSNAKMSLNQSNAEVSSGAIRFANVSSNQEMLNFNHQQNQTNVIDMFKCIQSLSSAIEASVNNIYLKDQKISKSNDTIKQLDSSVNSTNDKILSQSQVIENADKLRAQKDKQANVVSAIHSKSSQFDNQISDVKGQVKGVDLKISGLKKQLLAGDVTKEVPKLDANGNPVIDEATGKPVMETKTILSTADIQAQIDKLEQQKTEMENQIKTLQADKAAFVNKNNKFLEDFKDLEKRCAASQKEKSEAQNTIITLNHNVSNFKRQISNELGKISGLQAEKAVATRKMLNDTSSKQSLESKLERAENAAQRSGGLVDSNIKLFNDTKSKLEANTANNNKKQNDKINKKSSFETSFNLYKSLLNKPENENIKKLNING